jgi:hypothetical protein
MANRKFGDKNLYEWAREQCLAHTTNDCLLWPYSTTTEGYGRLGLPPGKKLVLVHRLAFFFKYGRWPKDKCLHTCDTPHCFNWRHLFDGTQAENVSDMMKKGRGVFLKGSVHGNAKVNDNQVRAIRALYAAGMSEAIIAEQFGMAQTNVSSIVRRKTWKHVTE